jgi:hypothetical protein
MTAPTPAHTHSFVARLGTLPPQQLGLWFVGLNLALDGAATAAPSLAVAFGLVELGLLVLLVLVVAYLRDDEPVEAGVLIALITGVSLLTSTTVLGAVQARSLAPIVMTLPGAFLGLTVRAVIGGVVGGALVWVLRRLRRGSSPLPSTERAPARRRKWPR